MAGSNDFTGQNIQDTYQRVLQLSSSGQVADGTGSLVPLLKVTASFAISASHEITFELSSSHAQTADTASFINSTTLDTFKTTGIRLGDGFIDGNITASGDISASGDNHTFGGKTFIGDTTNEAGTQTMLTVGGAAGTNVKIYSTHIATNRNVGLNLSASANGQQYSIGLNRPNNTLYISPARVGDGPSEAVFEIDAVGNITASGNISSSGTLIGNALTLSGLSNQGSEATAVVIDSSDIVGTRELGSNAFTSTTIGTMTNALTVDDTTLQLDSGTTFDGSAARTISIKDGGVDSDALAANIAVTQLTASIVSASELIIRGAKGHITASGNISASGNILGDVFISNGISVLNNPGGATSNTTLNSVNRGLLVQGTNIHLNAKVTASQGLGVIGNVSASGAIITQHITASGNISASGNLIGGGLNINGTTTFNDGNITNVGIIDVDQVRADASTSTIITLGADAITNTVGGANVAEFTSTSIKLGTVANSMHVTASGNISASLISKVQAGSGSFHILQGDTTQDPALDVEGSITASVGIKTANLVLTNLSNQGSEATAVVIDGSNIVGTRELGSNAFTSTTVGTTTNALTVDNATLQLNSGTTFDGSAARTISIKDGGVDSDALAANIAVTQLTASIVSASGELLVTGEITTDDDINVTGGGKFIKFAGSDGFGIGSLASETLSIVNADDLSEEFFTIRRDVSPAQVIIPPSTVLDVQDTTAATDASGDTGAIRTEGGASIAKNISVGTHITASGNISASAGSILSVPQRHLDQTVQVSAGTQAQGDIYYAENAVSTTAGKIYALVGNGNQIEADKDVEISSNALLGVAIGTNSSTDGYLLRGMVKLATNPFPGEAALGNPAYLGDSGNATGSIAGHASDDFIRIVGYGISGSGTVYFDPDKTFIKKA